MVQNLSGLAAQGSIFLLTVEFFPPPHNYIMCEFPLIFFFRKVLIFMLPSSLILPYFTVILSLSLFVIYSYLLIFDTFLTHQTL